MKRFIGNIEEMTRASRHFRRVLFTGRHLQLVLMSIEAGEEIGEEIHDETDQFFRVEEGRGEVWIEGECWDIESEMAIVVPAGARHNIRNTGHRPLRLYTIYAPPHHADGTIHRTRADALRAEVEHSA